MTEQRERIRLPQFGGSLGRFLFEPNTVTTRHFLQDRITKALEEWEPRIRVESVTVEPDGAESAIATITYKLIATQTRERVSLSVSLSTS